MSERHMLQRRDYSFTLEVLSPLHIGAGRVREDIIPPLDESGTKRAVPVNAIIRGAGQKPYLPGSTLKGALRAAIDDPSSELFGDIKRDTGGRMGALMVRGALMAKPGDARGLPYAQDGVFVLSRTAIDAGRGIAARNKLFNMEAIAPGATFDVQLRLETRGDIDVIEAELLDVLACFAGPHGRSIGGDAASGFGRVRIFKDVMRRAWQENESGGFESDAQRPLSLNQVSSTMTQVLILESDGPFLTRDPAWTKEMREDAERMGAAHAPHLRALRHGTEKAATPFVTGQTVSGAMRARLDWLLACGCLRSGNALPISKGGISGPGDIVGLTSSERLFGVTGWKGVLGVSVISSERQMSCQTTSVKMDRFSGGTIDNALFTIDADLGTRVTVGLSLDRRASDDDRQALQVLLDDLTRNGLKFGHGVGRGFGWFKVKESADAAD